MKKKNRKMAALSLSVTVALTCFSPVLASEETEHAWSEWEIQTEADCISEGLAKRVCTQCEAFETKVLPQTEEHLLKETGREAATEDTPEFILYECIRDGCEYEEKREAGEFSADVTADEADEQEDISGAEQEQETQESDENVTIDEISDDEEVPEIEETISELPEIDPDTVEWPEFDLDDEEYLTFASATSTEIISEYDPETAEGTIEVAVDPKDPEETQEVRGMTVPGGTAKVTRDSEGNLTDLSLSMAIEEICNGFSVSSEEKTLHSVSIICQVRAEESWITLTAGKDAGELGIRFYFTDKEMFMVLTENEEELCIREVSEDADQIILVTSSGGTCIINKNVYDFTIEISGRIEAGSDRVVLHGLNEQNPYINFMCQKEAEDFYGDILKDADEKNEEFYWILPYDDMEQDPIVLIVYKNK